MIHQIFSSTLESFKTLDFRPGFNILASETARSAAGQQACHGTGMSSLLEIVHFTLGGTLESGSIFRSESLKQHCFAMAFDLGGSRTIVERCGESASQITLHEADSTRWSIRPTEDMFGKRALMKIDDWKTVLGEVGYELRSDWPMHSPTFRMLFPYFARRRGGGSNEGFLDPRRHTIRMQKWQEQVSLSFLLGLDWQFPSELEGVHLKEQSCRTMIRAARQLRSTLALTEQRVEQLELDIAGFRVLPEYEELEREAATLAVQIAQAANENTLDQENLDQLRRSFAVETPPSTNDVVRMYEEAGIVLTTGAVKRLDEVRRFHEVVILNRAAHLEADIQRMESCIAGRRELMVQKEIRRAEIMRTLDVHGALDAYTKIQVELTRLRSKSEELRRHQEVATQMETSLTELFVEREELLRRMQLHHRQQESGIKEAVLLFQEVFQSLCEYKGTLDVNVTERGPEFDIQVEGIRSKGVQQMQIFCFDLMLMVLMTRRGLGLGFLIHDSHLFDGMDSRQVGKALQIGAETAAKYGFQYIVTLNSDTLELPDVRRSFEPSPYLLPIRLTDATESGGLFGFRFD